MQGVEVRGLIEGGRSADEVRVRRIRVRYDLHHDRAPPGDLPNRDGEGRERWRGSGRGPGRQRHPGGNPGRHEPQHVLVTGGGSAPRDFQGNPWNAGYIIASGNLLADFHYNVTAESQGRLQVSRLYQLNEDASVRDMLSFLIARDRMHQNQWLAAIEELKADGLEESPVPSNFPADREMMEVGYKFMNFSEGEESAEGRWAHGEAPDGKGEFEYVREPAGMGPVMEELDPPVEPRLYSTPNQPMQPSSS